MINLRVKLTAITTCLALVSAVIAVLASHLGNGSTVLLAAGVVAGSAVAGIVSFIMLGSLEKIIFIMLDRTGKAIKADLRDNIPEGEFGWYEVNVLANNVRKVLKGVHKWFRLVHDHSIALERSNEQLNVGADQVSTGSQEQAMQVQRLSQVIEDLASTSEQSAVKARQAMECAGETGRTVKLGRESVKKVIGAMNGIDQKTSDLAQNAAKIEQFVQLIENIASQTNLLALNAAIEAARAGEHGRGFAVVAEEVRKLADGSTNTTHQIIQLVADIQKSTGESVDAVRQGLELTGEVQEAFNGIAQQITEMTQLIEKIATTVDEQASTTVDMANSTRSIYAVAQEAAATSEETFAIVQELSKYADELKEVAGIWKF